MVSPSAFEPGVLIGFHRERGAGDREQRVGL